LTGVRRLEEVPGEIEMMKVRAELEDRTGVAGGVSQGVDVQRLYCVRRAVLQNLAKFKRVEQNRRRNMKNNKCQESDCVPS